MRKSVFLFLLLVIPGTAQAQISGIAEAVAGDVLRVNGVTVHLHGIAAPEPGRMCRANNKSYPCGHVAKTALMDLVFGGTVSCRLRKQTKAGLPEADCQSGGFDIAANMVHTGWAVADPATGKKYAIIEARARKARRGLWRGEFSLSGHGN